MSKQAIVSTSIAQALRSILRDASLYTGIYRELFFRQYPFMYEPHQLITVADAVDSVVNVAGCFVEAGCAYGATTVFLNKYMGSRGIDRPYYAVDTFAGFTKRDMDYETKQRGKRTDLKPYFTENKQSWFDESMRLHNI